MRASHRHPGRRVALGRPGALQHDQVAAPVDPALERRLAPREHAPATRADDERRIGGRQALEVVHRRHRCAEAAGELLGDVEAVACRLAARGCGYVDLDPFDRAHEPGDRGGEERRDQRRQEPAEARHRWLARSPVGTFGDFREQAIEVGAKAQHMLGRERSTAVDGELPGVDEGGHEIAARRRQRGAGETDAIALGAGIADRDLVRMDEPRQRAAIEQRERGTMLAGEPQLAHGGADVGGQALGPDVELAHMARQARAARADRITVNDEPAPRRHENDRDRDRGEQPDEDATALGEPAGERHQPGQRRHRRIGLGGIAEVPGALLPDAAEIGIGAHGRRGRLDAGGVEVRPRRRYRRARRARGRCDGKHGACAEKAGRQRRAPGGRRAARVNVRTQVGTPARCPTLRARHAGSGTSRSRRRRRRARRSRP